MLSLSFFLYKNQQTHLGPSRSPPGDLHGHSQFLGEAKQTFPWSKSLPPPPCSVRPLHPATATQEAASCGASYFYFYHSTLDRRWAERGYPHRFLLPGFLTHRTTLAYGGLSCNQSLASCGIASLPDVSSSPITHPTALDGHCGRAGELQPAPGQECLDCAIQAWATSPGFPRRRESAPRTHPASVYTALGCCALSEKAMCPHTLTIHFLNVLGDRAFP